VIWCGNDTETGFLSSHRLLSTMGTHSGGGGYFGHPTGKRLIFCIHARSPTARRSMARSTMNG
jgi:hypothetical protein